MKKLIALLAMSTLLFGAACSASVSVGDKKVKKSEVEAKAKAELEASVAGDVTIDITCPDDLDGEEGATMTCTYESSDGGSGDVNIEVTSIEGNTVNFSAKIPGPDDGTDDGGTDTGS